MFRPNVNVYVINTVLTEETSIFVNQTGQTKRRILSRGLEPAVRVNPFNKNITTMAAIEERYISLLNGFEFKRIFGTRTCLYI